MTWLDDIKGWFGALQSGIRTFELGQKKAFEWLLNHLYALILPILVAVKSVWDFFVTLGDRITAKLSEIQLDSMLDENGLFASVLDVLGFVNSFMPLQELFIWGVVCITFWGVCLLIRTIKGVKQTVLF